MQSTHPVGAMNTQASRNLKQAPCNLEVLENVPSPEPIPLSLIGELFIARRKELGISQQELGQRLGMLREAIVRWEASKYSTVSMERLTKVSQALELEVSLLTKPASQETI